MLIQKKKSYTSMEKNSKIKLFFFLKFMIELHLAFGLLKPNLMDVLNFKWIFLTWFLDVFIIL
jgi:hypothetical protein